MTILLKNKHTLQVDDFYFKCCVGKNGISNKKKEGDNKTPKGTYGIQHLYYRKDKLKKPNTSLKCIGINKNMGWCDDLNAPKKYNQLIKIKKNIKYEKLYRHDYKYDLLIPIKYNFKKRLLRFYSPHKKLFSYGRMYSFTKKRFFNSTKNYK